MTEPFLQQCLALAPQFSLHELSGGQFLLLSEERTIRLKDAAYQDVLPHLTGWLTGEQIVDQMIRGNDTAQERAAASTFLRNMVERGYVVPIDPWADRARTAYRAASGHDPVSTDQTLARAGVALMSLGGQGAAGAAATADLTAYLAAEGIGLCGQDHAKLVIVAVDDYLQPGLEQIAADFRRRQLPWLPFKPAGRQSLLGPLMTPWSETGGCYHCLARRMVEHRPGDRLLPAKPHGPRPAKGWTRASLALAQAKAAMILTRHLLGDDGLFRHLLSWSQGEGARERHPVPRYPDCPHCGDGKRDKAPKGHRVRIAQDGVIGAADAGWRSLSPEEALARLDAIVSPLTGIVSGLRRLPLPEGLHVYVAAQAAAAPPDPRENRVLGKPSGASGKGLTDIQARISCLAEAVERYAAQWVGSDETRIASWREMKDDAPHPQSLLGFSARQYAERESRNALSGRMNRIPEPFRPDAAIEWCPAWSLTEDRECWLPARLCYYDYRNPAVAQDHAFCLADSNGCASGGTLEEAMFQGLLELVERDAIAIWWYNRLRLPAIDPAGLDDVFMARLKGYFQAKGKNIHLLDLTTDLGVPVVAAMAADANGARVMIGMGAHLDGRVAALRAVSELLQTAPFDEDSARQSSEVDQELWDWLDKASFETEPYLMPADGEVRQVSDLPRPSFETMGQALQHLVDRLASAGHEVIVQNLSRSDLPVHCVRMVAPGLVHFWNRRGTERLYQAPVAMGRLPSRLAEAELNPLNFFL